MASEIHMPAPKCLIENINGQLLANSEALKILSAIGQPVVVVAIVGLYRTGKSYLMNKLAGKEKGFSLGSTVQSHTKGIWMWCVPHPEKPDHTLVLLDTEGLGDVEKGDNQNDSWIFALAVLLSSTFVYNSIGTINQQAMDQLHYVTELTGLIRAKSSPDKHEVQDSANFVSFFPDFVWTLRDFSLQLEADGQPITADEYLENSLKLKQGNDTKTKHFNEPRLCIRKFFPEKKCFIFDRPAHRKYLIHLEQLQEEDLNPEFREQVADFCFYILSHSKAKTLSGGITVNGPRLESLVLTYVNSISSGDLPCMESAVLALAEIENLAAVQKAIAHYDEQMGQKLKLPTETLQELLDLHRATEKKAIEVFMKHSFKDEDQVFQKTLGNKLEAKRDDFCKQNMKASSDYCMALIQDIFCPLYEDVKQGTFSKPGGYYLFIKKMNELKDKYHQVPGKGVQAEETLSKYLDSKEGVADALLQTDQSLTEKEKEIEVERMKSEAAEAANKMLEEMQKKNEQMMREKEASYQEHVKQLTEKMEKERAQLIADQERVLALKLQPVVVVAIVGLYRTGKSSLMKKLAGKNKGFSLGSTMQSHTKGMWMWCVPHPKKPNRTLVLPDTEGLGDAEKGDKQNDSWIFVLAILLSSTFVYNSMGTINQQAMDQLHYVTELTDRVRARSSPDVDGVEDSADFVSFFPDFVWTLRDFSLDLKADGESITADEYLENSLKLKKGTSSKDTTFNLPRLCIRKFFPKKKCFISDWPIHRKKLGQLEELCDDELDSEFVQQPAVFCSYIFSNSKTKTLSGGIKVDGPLENAVLVLGEIENSAAVQKAIAQNDQQMSQKLQLPSETLQELLDLHRASEKEATEVFMKSSFKDIDQLFQKELAVIFFSSLETLVQTYVNAINSGDLPCMENAVLALDEIENSAAVQKAIAHYDQQMSQKLQLPSETLQELLDLHRASEKEATEAQLGKKQDDFCNQNLKASEDHCSALLKDIFSPLEEDVKQGIYLKPGGYRLLMEKRQELKKKYFQEPRKGIQAEEILQEYLKSRESVTDVILQTDQTLSEKEKLIEVEHVKAESAQAAATMLEEMQIRNQQMMEEKEKSHQEHVKQLTEKMERERAQLLEEQERTLALKLQEQSRLLQEGCPEESRRLHSEIQNLQKEMNEPKKGCVLG
ncbi:hypothetical protein AB1E18_002160 [Capra hircus]